MKIRRMKNILALSALLLLALPVVASAQTSRVEGMALQGDFIKDWSNIFTYTSQVPNVGNLVYGELGNVSSSSSSVTSDRSVGAVIGNLWEGRLGTWAIHLREETPQLGQGDASSSPGAGGLGVDPNTNTFESFDLMWGKKFGTTNFGLRLNRSFASDVVTILGATSTLEADFTLFDPNLARNVLGVGAGIGFEMNPTSNVEFNVLWQNRTWSDVSAGVSESEDGAQAYQLAGRAMWQWQPNIMVMPVFKYQNFDLSRQPTSGAAIDNSLKGWQIGVAGNWSLGSNDLFVLGVNMAQNKFKQSELLLDPFDFGFISFPSDSLEITESLTPQVFAALETHVNSWLTLRFGANKGAWEKVKVLDSRGTLQERQGGSFNMRLGAGVKVGNLQLDAILDDNFPHSGPYFISGNQTSDMFAKVSATYPF